MSHSARPRPSAPTEPTAEASAANPGEDAAKANGEAPTDDEVTEADAPVAEPTYVQELEARLAEREERLQATLQQYKEALDDFHRTKARLKRDIEKEIAAGKRSILSGLLEIVDNLERALDAASADPAQADTPLCRGITMVRDQFGAKLNQLGVHKLEAAGQPFDPVHFEAIANVPVDSADKDGVVIGVVRDAYVMGTDTLRPGMVAVGKFSA